MCVCVCPGSRPAVRKATGVWTPTERSEAASREEALQRFHQCLSASDCQTDTLLNFDTFNCAQTLEMPERVRMVRVLKKDGIGAFFCTLTMSCVWLTKLPTILQNKPQVFRFVYNFKQPWQHSDSLLEYKYQYKTVEMLHYAHVL